MKLIDQPCPVCAGNHLIRVPRDGRLGYILCPWPDCEGTGFLKAPDPDQIEKTLDYSEEGAQIATYANTI